MTMVEEIIYGGGYQPGFDTYDRHGMVPAYGVQSKVTEPPPASGDQTGRPVWLESLLAQNKTSRICLSESVAKVVLRHVAKNQDRRFVGDEPQILIITGPFGCGKTVNTRETLRRSRCEIVELHASELESHLSNVPVERIRARYIEASEGQKVNGTPHVLLIEDIHMAFNVDGNTSTTTNLKMAMAALMGICDNPVQLLNKNTERIPIIATANDLSKVYGALIRPGRTRVVAMELSDADRQRIVTHMFGDVLQPKQIAALLATRPQWSIATFRQLRATLLDDAFDRLYWGRNAEQVLVDSMSQPAGAPDDLATDVAISRQDLERAIAAIDREWLAKGDFTGVSTSN